MRGWHLIPIVIVVLVVVGLPLVALTDSGIEHDLRKELGISTGECEPTPNLASAWRSRTDMPYDLDEPRAIALDGEIYLVGGITGIQQAASDHSFELESSAELTRFDPVRETFTELTPMPLALNHIGVVPYDHRLYVLGGYQRRLDENTGNEFLRYDPKTDHWSRMPPMPTRRAAMAAAVVGHELIVAGGARDNVPVSETIAFDFGSGRWIQLPDMHSSREHVGSTVVGDRLYVLGGRAPQSLAADTAESYDASEHRWRILPHMPVGSGGLGVVSVGHDVVAVGGGNDEAGTVTGAVQEFDPRTARWKLLSDMRTARHGHATAAVGNAIWVFGGSPCPYYNASDSVESLVVKPGF
ncbi:MAG TPA: kelch repeat-containing protein [Solirubrobacterales bacterium]|nr:kelch repeat-containing protein [Solirubrobacterales bacterium]